MESNSGKVKTVFAPSKLGWAIILIVMLGVLAFSSYYFYSQYQKSKELVQIPQNAQSRVIIEAVGKLMELPQGEQPAIATVSDITKLQDQPFFANAQNGDKVLIYALAKKAILYRPGINKIINVAPVDLNSNPNLSSSSSGNLTATASATPR